MLPGVGGENPEVLLLYFIFFVREILLAARCLDVICGYFVRARFVKVKLIGIRLLK